MNFKCVFTQIAMLAIVGMVHPCTATEPPAKIGSDWLQKNPGRLQLSVGAAFNGSNGYTFRLLSKSGKKCRFVVTTCVRGSEKDSLPQLKFSAPPTFGQSVSWNTSTWQQPGQAISFVIIEEELVTGETNNFGFRQVGEYEISLGDLGAAHFKKLPSVDFEQQKHEELATVKAVHENQSKGGQASVSKTEATSPRMVNAKELEELQRFGGQVVTITGHYSSDTALNGLNVLNFIPVEFSEQKEPPNGHEVTVTGVLHVRVSGKQNYYRIENAAWKYPPGGIKVHPSLLELERDTPDPRP